MSKPKHTPGPWEISRNDVHAASICTIHHCLNNDWVEIWSPNAFSADEHEMEANSILIHAAPDMAAALKALLDHYVALAECGDCGWWDQEKEQQVIAARAALAKAGL